MKLHGNAALTVAQRKEVRRLRQEEGLSLRALAERFQVSHNTIDRWIHREDPHDRSCAPHHHATVVTEEYRSEVLKERKEHPDHGPVRLAQDLRESLGPLVKPGTVYNILRRAGTPPAPKTPKPKDKPQAPVGHFRVQMDIQQLPAVEGNQGFEYKISAIHLRTRLKYSEIHLAHDAKTVAGVLERAMDHLPPFIWCKPTTRWSSR